MLPTAVRLRSFLGPCCRVPDAENDVRTGPEGAPMHRRWITAWDVLAHQWRSVDARARSSWDLGDESDLAPRPRVIVAATGLRDYQQAAVDAVVSPDGDVVRSGIVDVGCGLGKTWIIGELVRRTPGTAVVVVPHDVAQIQTKRHLVQHVGLDRVFTSDDDWKFGDPFPDALVCTYQAVVMAAKAMDAHGRQAAGQSLAAPQSGSALLWLLHCKRFGLLALDEVHSVVADHFRSALRLRASAVVGATGSLVREDDRIARLSACVGPCLVSYHADRRVHYRLFAVPYDCGNGDARGSHTRFEQALRTLNPAKIAVLRTIVAEERAVGGHTIVFCKSRRAAEILARHFAPCELLNGGVARVHRDAALRRFRDASGGVMVCTQVCDCAIDFPDGCVVVQAHVANGSRQQEVQRIGRGVRSTAGVCRMVHLVNCGTTEEAFVHRRTEHVRREMGGADGSRVHIEWVLEGCDVAPADHAPLHQIRAHQTAGGEGAAVRPRCRPRMARVERMILRTTAKH